MAGLHLEGEDDELLLEDEITGDSSVSADLCLVGRFITDQPVNFNLMRSRLASIWRPGKGVFMKDIGEGRFIFQFFHEVDLKRVFEGGPWSFGNLPLILHHLRRGEFPLKVPLDTLPFWVQIHDLPAGYLTEGIGKLLGKFIGTFLEYDSTNSTGVWRQYMRVRVGVRVDEPLKRFKKIKNKDGSSFTVNFRYERLHIFCFLCGRLGHSENFCELMFNAEAKNSERQWGAWLKAADRRSQTLAGDKWIRTDGGEGNPSGVAAQTRVSPKAPQTEPKQKEQESRSLRSEIISTRDSRESIPQILPRQILQDISYKQNNPDFMQLAIPDATYSEERKRRRGYNSENIGNTSSSELFLAGSTGDGSDVSTLSTAGSEHGVGRFQ
ncbi:uncharacterized protein LOC131008489 [Salvia miltiorrhiza]|uniref:uncharacterized protein LOC131008489 n=1 Tax=Salvia miltiorrhiza TaxID=226208 RepID=UPI0025AB86EB|nr:uncharacterized protein LOC131008489 [Salvia miltiorrhiza]